MSETDSRIIWGKLDGLRTELVEMAFVLDRRGRIEAADVAMTISGRVGELCEELAAGQRESGTKLPEDETAA
jgi:hypothetical protein